MKSITLTIEITDEEFEALKRIKENRIAEFRDPSYSSYENYVKFSEHENKMTLESFNKRNFGGLLNEVSSLFHKDLVDLHEDSWHLSYVISDLGLKFFD